jgi:hypothetical protein
MNAVDLSFSIPLNTEQLAQQAFKQQAHQQELNAQAVQKS